MPDGVIVKTVPVPLAAARFSCPVEAARRRWSGREWIRSVRRGSVRLRVFRFQRKPVAVECARSRTRSEACRRVFACTAAGDGQYAGKQQQTARQRHAAFPNSFVRMGFPEKKPTTALLLLPAQLGEGSLSSLDSP